MFRFISFFCIGFLISLDCSAQTNDLFIEQIGDLNRASVQQWGGQNRAEVRQNGFRGSQQNRAMIHQGEYRADELAHQAQAFLGLSDQRLTFDLVTGLPGRVVTEQPQASAPGSVSAALEALLDMAQSVDNTGGLVGDNEAKVTQTGTGNRALSVQAGVGNVMNTLQVGNTNVGVHLQTGVANNTALEQVGNNNRNALIATGNAVGYSGGAFTLRVEGDRVANGLALQVSGAQAFDAYKVQRNHTGGFTMQPMVASSGGGR